MFMYNRWDIQDLFMWATKSLSGVCPGLLLIPITVSRLGDGIATCSIEHQLNVKMVGTYVITRGTSRLAICEA